MRSRTANEDSLLSRWLHVREYAVPPHMIETATARRAVGDWAGACAAARIDVDLRLSAVSRAHGRELTAQLRADLRHLAPDLLRWHMPRIAPDGLLRPGLTISLARYHPPGQRPGGGVHLVARTPPAWADAGQRISLALWDSSRPGGGSGAHPHSRPDRRFRLDLHRHLWDARRTTELRPRSGADHPTGGAAGPGDCARPGDCAGPGDGAGLDHSALRRRGCAVDRWAAEAELLLRTDARADRVVTVRLGSRSRLRIELPQERDHGERRRARITPATAADCPPELPVLPDAATWIPPDLALLRAGLIKADRLHPLVAAALVADGDHPPPGVAPARDGGAGPYPVECRGAAHRIGVVNGVLVPLDHDPAEIRREELLAALTGTPLPCLKVIDELHRHPVNLVDVRARLDHGDTVGALADVEALLGPGALLRDGDLRDELETAARRRVAYGLFRAGLAELGPAPGRPARSPTSYLPGPPAPRVRWLTSRILSTFAARRSPLSNRFSLPDDRAGDPRGTVLPRPRLTDR